MRKAVLILSLLLSALVQASEPESAALPFSELSPKSSALGNPAMELYSGQTFSAGLAYLLWAPESGVPSNIIGASAAYNFASPFLLSASFAYSNAEPYEIYNNQNVLVGQFVPKDMSVELGAAYDLGFMSLGANFRYLNSTLSEDLSLGAACADIFAAAEFGNFTGSAGLRSLGGKVGTFSLPTALAVGLVYNMSAGASLLKLSLDGNYYLYGGMRASFAADYCWNDMISLRAAYNYGMDAPLPSFASLGLGLKFSGIELNAAYMIASETLAGTLAFGLSYSF